MSARFKIGAVKIRREKLILFLLILFLFLLRLPYLTNNPTEYHGWRQSDTEAIARNFLETGWNIFLPQLNYDGPLPNYVQLELQITTFLIALLYRLFGYNFVLARLVPLFFFLGSGLYLYLLTRMFYGPTAGYFALTLYGVYPFDIFISRAIMPEACALFFYMGAFYYFMCWAQIKKTAYLYTAALFTALAIAEKVPAVFIGLPFIYLVYTKYGLKFLRNVHLWLFSFISLGLPILYYAWLGIHAETAYVNGIAKDQILPGITGQIFTMSNLQYLESVLVNFYTRQGLSLYLFGLLTLGRSYDLVVLVWNIAIWLEVLVITSIIKLDYYVFLLSPLPAFMGGKLLAALGNNRLVKFVGILVVLSILQVSWQQRDRFYLVNSELIRQAQFVERVTDKNDLIVTGSTDPEMLNLSHRKGWRATLVNPERPDEEIADFIASGALYYVHVPGGLADEVARRYESYLAGHYKNIAPPDLYPVYRLDRRIR